MTTLYKYALEQHFQYELCRMKERLEGKGNYIIDNSFMNGFLKHRIGVTSIDVQSIFYRALIEDVFPCVTNGTVSFPHQTDIEYGVFARGKRKYLKDIERDGATPEHIAGVRTAVENIEGLNIFMRTIPSEVLVKPEIEVYRPQVQRAIERITRRPGIMKESYDPSRVEGREEHKNHDMQIMTTALLVGLSDPDQETYVHTRDSDIRNIGSEIRREDGHGIESLAGRYGFPCPPGFGKRVHVMYDSPRGKTTLARMRDLADAHNRHVTEERNRHRGKRITAS